VRKRSKKQVCTLLGLRKIKHMLLTESDVFSCECGDSAIDVVLNCVCVVTKPLKHAEFWQQQPVHPCDIYMFCFVSPLSDFVHLVPQLLSWSKFGSFAGSVPRIAMQPTQQLPPSASAICDAVHNLSVAYAKLKQHDEALALQEKLLDLRGQLVPADEFKLQTSMLSLANS
jgi:hypothetical protein